MKRFLIAVVGIALAASMNMAAHAQDAEPYTLDGETIRFLLPNAAGGNADNQTRLLVEYMAKYLPGEPTIVIQNLNGAGGVRMMQYISQLDPMENPMVFNPTASTPFQAAAGLLEDGLFDPRTTNWVGSFRGMTQFCILSTASGIETVEDMIENEMLFAATSAGGTSAALYTLMRDQLGLNIVTVAGYDSFGAEVLAVERGEVAGMCNNYSAYETLVRPSVDAGDVRFAFYLDLAARDDILEAPFIGDMGFPPDRVAFVQSTLSAILFTGVYAVPEGSDPRFVAAIREAFDLTVADPDFQAAAIAYGIDLKYQSAADLEARVTELYALPETAVDEIGRIFGD